MHAFDRVLFWRALALTALLGVVALAVAVITDESYSSWGMRVARMSALAPALAALGAGVALGQARSRGELRALHALGVSPLRVALGPMLAGWATGSVAVALVLSPAADVSALFPKVACNVPWTWDGAALVSGSGGLRVTPAGVPELGGALTLPVALAAPTRWAAALAVAPLGLVAPVWVSAPVSLRARAVAVAMTGGLTVLLLHAAAAQRLGPQWLVCGALPLALQAVVGHVRASGLPPTLAAAPRSLRFRRSGACGAEPARGRRGRASDG
jgi:hypothetical protein